MSRYVLTATGVCGDPFGEHTAATPPALVKVAAFGDRFGTDYVTVGQEPDGALTLYARDAEGVWDAVHEGADAGVVAEMRLWFELTHHHRGDTAGPGHPLTEVPDPAGGGQLDAARAVALVAGHIRERGLDHPVDGLEADRFTAGWSVYAPVDVGDSDPMAFLELPLDRSVFLVSDHGRIKEVTTAVPPGEARALFTGEEAFVRRALDGEAFMAAFKGEFERLDAASPGGSVVSGFTVVDEGAEAEAASRATALGAPLVQQLARLGPAGWHRMEAVFSCTVSAEVARLRFLHGERATDVPVPGTLALLVRRQRHLAARMPAGPWLRLLLAVDRSADGRAEVSTEYDYGDRPLPDDQRPAPAHYRNDLAAYPRPEVPAWLRQYVSAAQAPARPSPARPSPAPAPAPPFPVLDTRHGGKRLYADARQIVHGKRALELDAVEWLCFPVTRTAHKGFLVPTTYGTTYVFRAGTGEPSGRPEIGLDWYRLGKNAEPPAEWSALVELALTAVRPRLLTRLVGQVRGGATVRIGGLRVHAGGIASHRVVDASWAELSGARAADGHVWIYAHGRPEAIASMALDIPNAVLLPDLVAAFTG